MVVSFVKRIVAVSVELNVKSVIDFVVESVMKNLGNVPHVRRGNFVVRIEDAHERVTRESRWRIEDSPLKV